MKIYCAGIRAMTWIRRYCRFLPAPSFRPSPERPFGKIRLGAEWVGYMCFCAENRGATHKQMNRKCSSRDRYNGLRAKPSRKPEYAAALNSVRTIARDRLIKRFKFPQHGINLAIQFGQAGKHHKLVAFHGHQHTADGRSMSFHAPCIQNLHQLDQQ